MRFPVLALAAAGFVLAPTAPARAQGAPPAAPPLSWRTDSLRSTALGATRPYYVALPQGYAPTGDARYPVLVVLDADDQPQFTSAVANVQFLASRNAIPPLIVVGIPNGSDRTHDLTPPATGSFAQQFPTAGGADRFLDFITKEVVPAVRSRYRTVPLTILAGHSFGGLFALHASATRPEAFGAAIAMSPALQYNDSALVTTYAQALARRTVPLRLFTSRGKYEPPIDVTTRKLAALMDSTPNPAVATEHRYYPEDDHGLTPLPSLVEGLRFVFKPISLAAAPMFQIEDQSTDSATLMRALDETTRQYAANARTLSLPEQLPEDAVNRFGYGALGYFKQPGAAVAIMRRNVAAYPGSANVYDSLGDALLAAGDSTGARAQFAKAVEVAKRTGHPVGPESARKLASLGGAKAAAKRE
jgi:predicted alpha/beta superfamily hydrolase